MELPDRQKGPNEKIYEMKNFTKEKETTGEPGKKVQPCKKECTTK